MQISMAERRKFEEETLVNVSGRTRNRGATGRWTAQPGQNELIVVTILVAAQVWQCGIPLWSAVPIMFLMADLLD